MSQQQNTQTVPNFSIDFWADTVNWPAVAYGTPWNGWVTPIVTRETLEKIVEFLGNDKDFIEGIESGSEYSPSEFFVWDGDTLVIEGERLSPSEDSTYAFGFIGWTFITIREIND